MTCIPVHVLNLCMYVKYLNISKNIKLSHLIEPDAQCAQFIREEEIT